MSQANSAYMPLKYLTTPDILNYQELSSLFNGRPGEFIGVLRRVHEDFLNNYILIMECLSERNHNNFNKIYHDLRGNINLFDIHQLRQLMNNIETSIQDNSFDGEIFFKEVHHMFNLISESLENKIHELTHKSL